MWLFKVQISVKLSLSSSEITKEKEKKKKGQNKLSLGSIFCSVVTFNVITSNLFAFVSFRCNRR